VRTTFLALLLFALPAAAQGGEDAIPYPGDEDEAADSSGLPRRSEPTRRARVESEGEISDREESRADYDDPTHGFGGEFLAGLMLVDSARGALVDSRFMYGLRFVWEFGRMMSSHSLRDSLFADVTWSYTASRDGTTTTTSPWPPRSRCRSRPTPPSASTARSGSE
jgi:hypothetical protein